MIKYLLTAIIFVILDGLYINFFKNYFNRQIKSVQGSDIQINIIASGIVYIFLIFGLSYFIIQKNRSVKDAFILGLVIYAVYDFTNVALLKNWKVSTAILDTLWGGILFGSTTFCVNKITRLF
jgi:uncharacterized membrane protein